MAEALDQIFVNLKHWLVALVPEGWQPLFSALLSVAPILMVFPLLFAVTTVLERKILGRIQNRYGPNRVGPYGLLQPVADGLKMLVKEDIVPRRADQVVHFLAPIALVVPVLLAFAVLPYGRNMVPIELEAGVLFFFAVGAGTELAVFMGGWSSRNKYALLGAMRAVAQMISYEVPLILSSLSVIMIAGTLSLPEIVDRQAGYLFGVLPNWHVFTPWGLAGFVLFVIAAAAESNRTPFDIPEGESEIIAGYFIEYSGFKFALFFLGEYLGMFAISGLAITLFLGGWHSPIAWLDGSVPSYVWFFVKLCGFILMFIWLRGTLPRLRMDQLMNLAWKFMLPMALINIVATGMWRFMPPGLAQWSVSIAIILPSYYLLSRAFSGPRRTKRVYRYAS